MWWNRAARWNTPHCCSTLDLERYGRCAPRRNRTTTGTLPNPDLPPLVLTKPWIDERAAELPELPDAKRERLVAALGISDYDANLLTSDVTLAGYYEEIVAQGADAKVAANWVMGEVIGRYNQDGRLAVTAGTLAQLIGMVQSDVVSLQAAKRVFQELGDTDGDPQVVAQRLGLLQVGDSDALGTWG